MEGWRGGSEASRARGSRHTAGCAPRAQQGLLEGLVSAAAAEREALARERAQVAAERRALDQERARVQQVRGGGGGGGGATAAAAGEGGGDARVRAPRAACGRRRRPSCARTPPPACGRAPIPPLPTTRQVLSDSDQVTLNVGGARFTTTVSTLRGTPSLFSAMFSGRHELQRGPDGAIFIDRDGRHFADGGREHGGGAGRAAAAGGLWGRLPSCVAACGFPW
jgi:hypothetical protein